MAPAVGLLVAGTVAAACAALGLVPLVCAGLAVDPDPGVRRGYTVSVDLGGTPASARVRARAALLGLSNGRVAREDLATGVIVARADARRFGCRAEHAIEGRVVGTTATFTVRHVDRLHALDLGTTARQSDALLEALTDAAEQPE